MMACYIADYNAGAETDFREAQQRISPHSAPIKALGGAYGCGGVVAVNHGPDVAPSPPRRANARIQPKCAQVGDMRGAQRGVDFANLRGRPTGRGGGSGSGGAGRLSLRRVSHSNATSTSNHRRPSTLMKGRPASQ